MNAMDKRKVVILVSLIIFIILLLCSSLLFFTKSNTDKSSDTSNNNTPSRIANETTYENKDIEDEYKNLIDTQEKNKNENNFIESDDKGNSETKIEKENVVEKENTADKKSLSDEFGTYTLKKINGIKFRIYADGKRIPDANLTDTKSDTKPDKELVEKNTPNIMDKENRPDYLKKDKDDKLPKNYFSPNKYSKILQTFTYEKGAKVRAENDTKYKAKFASVILSSGETPISITESRNNEVPPYTRISFDREWYLENASKAKKIITKLDIPKETDYLVNEIKKVLKGNYISESKEHRITFDNVGGVQIEWYD